MEQHIQDYFEGILQIRGGSKELLQWVHNKIVSDGRARVAKEKKVKNGVDLYLSDQHYLQNLGRKIKEKFIGILKVSKRLHTMNKMTSRHVYRITVLFKVLPFKRGDIITVHGEQVEIMTIGHRAQIKNVKGGQKKEVSLDVLSRTIR